MMAGPAPRLAFGLYGKLPAHGDFVRRGLPAGGFCAAWDAWARAGMLAAREALGEAGWEAAWSAAPPWRFLLPPGACGPAAVAGVLLPSRDSVGRAFPLAVAALGPDLDAGPVLAWPPAGPWFPRAEGAAQAGRDGGLDADALLALLPAPAPADAEAAGDGAPCQGWWTAGTESAPGLVWPLPALPAPEAFAALLQEEEAAG